jgi:hypothetical protein
MPPYLEKRIQISRRSFLRRTTTAAATAGLPLWFIERELALAGEPVKSPSANERPRIALIGSGGMGTGDARNAKRFGDIVAVCDVDRLHVERAVAQLADEGKKNRNLQRFPKAVRPK